MYEIIDHTADVGIRVRGDSLAELFAVAAEATFDLIISSKREFIPSIDVPFIIDAPNLEQLFVRWLQEILFVFETRRLVLAKFWIDKISEMHLEASAKGTKFDSTRHHQKMAIKAVTYHGLKVEKGADGKWTAEVIFDV